MGAAGVPSLALRVERGRADDDELAAVAVVLCSVLAGRQAAAGGQEPESEPLAAVPSWRRPGLVGGQWRSPHCWR
ncbi:acyl-CoA carboxylase subunit epsilon [Streptomyces sp. NPDC059690]|uniref:acyl-CoA carboxylase subunit epsilon n=1 Tax=Streptomyces sp. NPDC059690 TaxID=3346907 RepID=UPI0036B32028